MKILNILKNKLLVIIILVLIISNLFFAEGKFEEKIIQILILMGFAFLFSLILAFFGANLWKTTKIVLTLFLSLVLIVGNESSTNTSNTSNSEHQCNSCKSTFYGDGWNTIGGEQYQQSTWNGFGYCSKTCAWDSQPTRWK